MWMILVLLAGCSLFEAEAPTHTVVRGDTLSRIARDQGCSVDDLRRWNSISGDLIEVGQVLIVGEPGGTGPPAPEAAPSEPRRERRTRPARTTLTPAGEGSTGAASLRMPPAQPCLAGPSIADEEGMEAGFAASKGLDGGDVRAALSAFEPTLLRCLTPGEAAAGTLDLELRVGCDGRVAAVDLLDGGGLPDPLVRCISDTLRYVPFPAHDMPDGFTFGYPLTVGP